MYPPLTKRNTVLGNEILTAYYFLIRSAIMFRIYNIVMRQIYRMKDDCCPDTRSVLVPPYPIQLFDSSPVKTQSASSI